MSKQRIKSGERIQWKTNLGNVHDGEVVAFVPAGEHVSEYADGLPGRVFCAWPASRDTSTVNRYLVRTEEALLASHDAPLADHRVLLRIPNASTVERQNPGAKREAP